FGVQRTGLLCLYSQAACLVTVVIAFVFFDNTKPHTSASTLKIILLFSGISASRFGLWGFDLAESQIMQESVHPKIGGALGATEQSLCNVFYLVSFGQTMVFHRPTQFVYPAFISFSCVAIAAITYTVYLRRTKHSL
ncbi:MAG: hypothetical protein ACOVP8_05245, partial [Phycisphaerales bacterium]